MVHNTCLILFVDIAVGSQDEFGDCDPPSYHVYNLQFVYLLTWLGELA